MDCSLYIHIPFCISKCAYCDFFSKACGKSADSSKALVDDDYIEALCREIECRISLNQIKNLTSIYVGGGTPSLLSPDQFNKIFSRIGKCLTLAPDLEITVEVNPDDVNEALLDALEACGVTRISCGIQSMNDEVLKRACRRSDAAMNKKALSLLKNKWRGELSLDLISGLPGDDKESLLESLEYICRQKPDHISLYSLTLEENTPFGKEMERGSLNYDFDKADQLWIYGRDFLEKCGYSWYEVSNFCLPGKECRHNLGYWNHKNYLGCGSGACGTLYNKDGSGLRWTNTTDIEEYKRWWLGQEPGQFSQTSSLMQAPQTGESIDLSTSQFEFFMMGLRKIRGVSEKEYKWLFGQNFPEHFLYLFNKWELKGLCIRGDDGNYAMSRQGMLFLNRFLEELF